MLEEENGIYLLSRGNLYFQCVHIRDLSGSLVKEVPKGIMKLDQLKVLSLAEK